MTQFAGFLLARLILCKILKYTIHEKNVDNRMFERDAFYLVYSEDIFLRAVGAEIKASSDWGR